MKLIIKTPKPRNPHAVAAKQRHAGPHGADMERRRLRRTEKQVLRTLVIGQNRKGEDDA
jgi:hypothetical protein